LVLDFKILDFSFLLRFGLRSAKQALRFMKAQKQILAQVQKEKNEGTNAKSP
jgi:hypothetical protein